MSGSVSRSRSKSGYGLPITGNIKTRATMTTANCVVVWCYFKPKGSRSTSTSSTNSSGLALNVFEPTISNKIETNQNGQGGLSNFPVDTKRSSPWSGYHIDLHKLRMTSSGDSYNICRQVCAADSIFSRGFHWLVEGDGRNKWITYDFHTTQIIENLVSTGNSYSSPLLDLTTVTGQPYLIDVQKKTQTNVHTNKIRRIKKKPLKTLYTTVIPSSTAPTSNASQAAHPSSHAGIQATKRPKRGAKGPAASSGQTAPAASASALYASSSSSSSSWSSSLSGSSSLASDEWANIRHEDVTEPLPARRLVEIFKENGTAAGEKDASKIEKYMTVVGGNTDDDGGGEDEDDELDKDCIICMARLNEASGFGDGQAASTEVVKLITCGHLFHKLCLLAMYKNDHQHDCLECPSCKTIYGDKFGNCPPGKMMWQIWRDVSCPGYEGYNVIRLIYDIPPGIQGPGHPNPGTKFSAMGFPREGFLPDCNKGRKVLKLLMEAFRRRLMFTIGTSLTTGRHNTVTWNEIHLKTEATANVFGHGYPDPAYLDNVLLELASHGLRE